MANRYDTNPLDPDFPEKAKAATARVSDAEATRELSQSGFRTQHLPSARSEDDTRRFDPSDLSAYSSPYSGQHIPADYRSAGLADMNHSSSRRIDKIGLPENILTALPYIPWYIGMVASLIVLFLVPKSEAKVRFHAAQGLAAHIGIFLVTSILGVVGNVTGVADVGNFIFQIVTTVMLFIFAYKAWKGNPVHIESVDSLTNWLEEKIKPKD